jgi:hypothetical protein
MGHYGLAIANAIASDSALHPYLSTGTGIGMGVALAAVSIGLGINRLSGFSIKGDVV